MPGSIEDYALIGDCHTGALVGRDGSIDWLCLPRFDSASTFGALLGDENHGRWRLAPVDPEATATRAYEPDTFVLVTRWETATGIVEVTDLMPHGDRRADVVRRVTGVSGEVEMQHELRIRFDYAAALPWVRQAPDHAKRGEHALIAVAGPDSVIVRGPRLDADDHLHRGRFTVAAGATVDTVLTWYPSHREPPPSAAVGERITATCAWWRDWIGEREDADPGAPGRYAPLVRRSLLVLRALTHEDTGGVVAAATTSLPESAGGSRNWDYRYVWLRDAALTLKTLMNHGFVDETTEWRDWLLRAVAGDPADVQIMYGLGGERRLIETRIPSLPGYRGASPVRSGNGAYRQFQGDVFGEILLALEKARQLGIDDDGFSWSLQSALLDFAERTLRRRDHGIWEIRGPVQRFTHSRAMLWAAFDCGVRAVDEHGLEGPADRWREVRERLRREIEGRADALGYFTQHDATDEVDASLLQLAQIGFVAPDDPRMLATVARIERDLLRDGLVLRYRTSSGVDGLAGDEHPFLACSFWLVQQYAMSGRVADAVALMDRLAGLANDVGLYAEEYDVRARTHMGNTPQALTHLALVGAADAIVAAERAEPLAGRTRRV